MPKRNPEKAVQMLDMLLEFFGEDGQRWIRGALDDPHGNRCLVGAMAHLRKFMNLKGDTAGEYPPICCIAVASLKSGGTTDPKNRMLD